jgi:hypothetical protein
LGGQEALKLLSLVFDGLRQGVPIKRNQLAGGAAHFHGHHRHDPQSGVFLEHLQKSRRISLELKQGLQEETGQADESKQNHEAQGEGRTGGMALLGFEIGKSGFDDLDFFGDQQFGGHRIGHNPSSWVFERWPMSQSTGCRAI